MTEEKVSERSSRYLIIRWNWFAPDEHALLEYNGQEFVAVIPISCEVAEKLVEFDALSSRETMKDHKVKFGTLNSDGTLTNQRSIRQSDIAACPHTIFEPDHYREDSTCRCDDPDHISMVDWGYTWNGTQWTA